MSKIDLLAVFEQLKKAKSELSSEQFKDAIINALGLFRHELQENRQSYIGQELNQIYAVSIFLRGYLDYLALRNIVSDIEWKNNHKAIDCVWTLLWDCKERMESYPEVVAGNEIESINNWLAMLLAFYEQNFGPGLYMSPDLKIKTRTCSICNENIKKCNHQAGKLYDGQMCRQIMGDIEMLSASVVQHPEDRRCRIWPWNYDPAESTFKAPIITFFLIDDFLHEEDWLKHHFAKQNIGPTAT